MDLFFTAKYNRFPVLLITSKHIMYIQLTSPLSHSQFLDWIGIIFQDFSSLQQNKTKQNESNRKKRPARKKNGQMFAYGGKGYCEENDVWQVKVRTSNYMVLYNEQIPKTGCQSSAVVTEHHIRIWLIEDSCCTLTVWKRYETVWPPARGFLLKDAAIRNTGESWKWFSAHPGL